MRVCVRVYVCVHAFRSVVTFGRMGLSGADICGAITYNTSHYLQSGTVEGM